MIVDRPPHNTLLRLSNVGFTDFAKQFGKNPKNPAKRASARRLSFGSNVCICLQFVFLFRAPFVET